MKLSHCFERKHYAPIMQMWSFLGLAISDDDHSTHSTNVWLLFFGNAGWSFPRQTSFHIFRPKNPRSYSYMGPSRRSLLYDFFLYRLLLKFDYDALKRVRAYLVEFIYGLQREGERLAREVNMPVIYP